MTQRNLLKNIFDRIEGKASAIETPIGNLPSPNSIDLEGLNLSERDLDNLLKVEIDGWLEEIPLIRDYYSSYGDKVPKELENELNVLTEKLTHSSSSACVLQYLEQMGALEPVQVDSSETSAESKSFGGCATKIRNLKVPSV